MKTFQFSTALLFSMCISIDAFSASIHGTAVRRTALFSTTEEKAVSVPDPAPAAAAATPTAATPTASIPAAVAPGVIAPTIAAPAAAAAPVNNQPKYGKELALPDTYVRCGRCAASYALTIDDLGQGKGRRVECSVCGHSWFQSRDRLFNLNEGRELIPLPEVELARIAKNIEKGRDPDFTGDTKFFVGNLDFAVQETDLWELFGEVGDVGEVSLVTGPDGRSRGFAFVSMMEEEDTEKCLALDATELKGRAINVKPPN